MRGLRFDPSKAVTFDLESGLVHLDGAPSRVLVPARALGALCAAAGPEATAAFGRELGAAMGRRLASRFAQSGSIDESGAEAPGAGEAGEAIRGPERRADVRAASLEEVVDHLGGELALAGLGSLGLERWGRALVLVLDHCPLGAEAAGVAEAVLEGALEAAAGRPARALQVDRDADRARFLISGAPAVARVRAWLAAGVPWGEALVKLHAAPRGEA
ncbi:MAG: hypothetical protein IT372_02620 [Polyangiaceae bacterium]|nr:hypothetical protein [Polyangiaceae bacterium]